MPACTHQAKSSLGQSICVPVQKCVWGGLCASLLNGPEFNSVILLDVCLCFRVCSENLDLYETEFQIKGVFLVVNVR